MIEGLKPYAPSKLKPMVRTSAINIPWLTAIPAHWQVVRAKGLFTARTERARPDDEQLSATQAYGVIPQKEFERRVGRKVVQITQHLDKRAHVEPDDFVISMRSFQGGLERAWARGCIRSSYVVLKPSPKTQVGYFSHLFKSLDYIRALQATGNFIRDGQDLNFNNFSLVDLPLPPLDEQADIAKCLDHANRKIDGFIRAKRKLIGLLNEQKQAIIHRAVTRGLHPDAPLKPSGIPWLGDIPQHWDIRPIKQTLLRMDYGTSESSTGNGKYRVLTMGHIQDGRVRVPNEGGINQIPAGLSLQTNDLLFNRTNSPELVGKVGIFTGSNEPPVTFASYLVRLRVRSEHNPSWLNYLLNSFRFWAFARSQALVSLHQANLNSSRYGRMNIPVPTRLDQDAIVEHIHENTSTIDTAIARTEREIALMQEYRTRLTADLVTGKLDVREAAAKLPEVEAEPAAEEALEEIETEETEV